MYSQISQMMVGAEGRYLTSAEMENISEMVKAFQTRFEITQRLEAKEEQLIKSIVEKSLEHFPQFAEERPNVYEKCVRDETLVLRYAAMAYLNDDDEIFTEKIMYWMRTVVKSMNFDDVAKYTYTNMQESVSDVLGDDATGINKYLQMIVEVMDE
jgi:predicted RNA-binding protein Jag